MFALFLNWLYIKEWAQIKKSSTCGMLIFSRLQTIFPGFLLKITQFQDFSGGRGGGGCYFPGRVRTIKILSRFRPVWTHHYVAFTLPMILIQRNYTGSRLQRVWLLRAPTYNEQIFFQQEILLIDIDVLKVQSQAVPLITSTFSWISCSL